MSVRRGLAAWLLVGPWALVGAGCGAPSGRAETGVLLVVEADSEVQARAERLQVRLWGRAPGGSWEGPQTIELQVPERGLRWPRRGSIEPRGGDASRRFRLEVAAYEAGTEAPLLVARAESGFAVGQWRRLVVYLASACFGVRCGEEESCERGVCVPQAREPEDLPRLEVPDEEQGVACSSDEACEDGDPCTVDWCLNGRCHSGRPPDGALAFREVLASDGYTCAIDVLGRLWCWGGNEQMQLGLGDREARHAPARVEALEGVRQVSGAAQLEIRGGVRLAVRAVVCAVTMEGGVWCWGSRGPWLGDRAGPQQLPPGPVPDLPAGRAMVQVAAGLVAVCALDTQGSVWCWGSGQYGGTGPSRAGTNDPVPRRLEELPPMRSLVASQFYEGGVSEDGRAWIWGTGPNSAGNFPFLYEAPVPSRRLVDLSLRSYRTLAVDADGVVFHWGVQVPRPGVLPRVGRNIWLDGVVVRDVAGGYDPPNLSNNNFSCVLDAGSRAWCWGNNTRGQLGLGGTSEMEPRPRRLARPASVARLDAGGRHTCAIDVLGRLWCWGANDQGQLGVGDTEDRSEPVRVGAELSCP